MGFYLGGAPAIHHVTLMLNEPNRPPASLPFMRPFLHALDRMRERETLQPHQLTARATALLEERFGLSMRPAEAAFAHGATGVVCDHTRYFDGFALLLHMPYGTAVAVREAATDAVRVAFEGGEVVDLEPEAACGREAAGVVGRVLRLLLPAGSGVEAAVVGTVPEACTEAALTSLGVAAGRALQSRFALALEPDRFQEAVHAAVTDTLEAPFSIAYVLAADADLASGFSLVDTGLSERIGLDALPSEMAVWALVDPGWPLGKDARFYERQAAQVEAATERLRAAMPALESLRHLEHRDLDRALAELPRGQRPLVRALVTENQRVQRMTAAIRRGDAQMLGGLLLMSHAAQRSGADGTTPAADAVVEQAEALTLEGVYGARIVGRGGGVLVLGRPYALPEAFDRVRTHVEAAFGQVPKTRLL